MLNTGVGGGSMVAGAALLGGGVVSPLPAPVPMGVAVVLMPSAGMTLPSCFSPAMDAAGGGVGGAGGFVGFGALPGRCAGCAG